MPSSCLSTCPPVATFLHFASTPMVKTNHSPILRGLHEFHVQRDCYLIAHQNPARFQCCVPYQSVIFAVDLRGRREADPRTAPRVPGWRCESFHLEDNFPSNTANRQITGYRELA